MGIDLTRLFLKALSLLCAAFAALCFLKGRFRHRLFAVLGDALRCACLQGFLNLVFFAVYAMYVKNGRAPSASDIGVSLLPLSVLVFWAAWRLSALSAGAESLLFPLCYGGFLLFAFFKAKGGAKFFGYVLLNPAFGFIGSSLLESRLRPLAAVSALLPAACAALGRGLAAKGIDKRQKA